LSEQFQDIEWAREALLKLKESNAVIPVWLNQQSKDIISILNNANYPVLQIDHASLQHPVLSVYRELTSKEDEDIKSIILKYIPYASNVKIIVKHKSDLLSESREGLDQLHIDYHLVTTAKNYTFIIHTNLSDQNIHSLQYFINDFYKRWGDNIVTFSVNLNENWLKDKSYLKSQNGYMILNQNHWFFSPKNGNIEND